MRIIVAGGRDFDNYELLEYTLNYKLSKIPKDIKVEIVCGKAKGADTLGELFALRNKIPIEYFKADWNTYGNSAGFIRNNEMAEYALEDKGLLIAFWDMKSKGTRHMIDLAKKYKLEVDITYY